jgi:hypothetical protein
VIRSCDAGDLELGGGLEVLLTAVLEGAAPGESVDIKLVSRSTALELPGWARQAGHEVLEHRAEQEGSERRFVVRLRRGDVRRVLAPELPPRGEGMSLREGGVAHSADLRSEEPPERLEPASGFIPLGAIAEAGGPSFDWGMNERDSVWAKEIAELTERATSAQWDASVDIPWAEARGLPDEIERAVSQVMTYIAQNEFAALYVPARFLSQVNPGYMEVLLWLSSHVHDEARHVEVFTKRALVGGASSYALASTELSLQTLLDERDFSSAALLLNVLGEGTFLDLLKFVERHAPDPATAAAARLAHRDEQRHVHFGIAHMRQVLRADPSKRAQLVEAVESRAAKLTSLTGLSPLLLESLTMMVAGSLSVTDLSSAAAEVRKLMHDMETNRIRRLRAAGFSQENASYLSDLHTPNLM